MSKTLSPVKQSILKTLLYYDIFGYPLTYKEIKESIATNPPIEQPLTHHLNQLLEQALIYEHNGYYYLGNDWKVGYRKQGNQRALRHWKVARWASRLIGLFPFVRAVMISGSMSKGFMDKKGDIDYFIITEPGRLWVCRTLLILFKKVFLLNSYKWFCLNYFIDAAHLEIEDKNLYTATELVTLKATFNPSLYKKLMEANKWVEYYYPNFRGPDLYQVPEYRKGWLKGGIEKLLTGKFGEKLDHYFMQKTAKHWQKRFDTKDPEQSNASIKSRRHLSKQNPVDFQTYVLKAYKKQIQDFERKYQIGITLNGEMDLPESKKVLQYE